MLEEMSQRLKRDFWNCPAGDRGDVKCFRGIRGTKM